MADFQQLHDIPAHWAALRPDATALVDSGQRWSWSTLWQQVQAAAAALDQLGLRAGERLAVVGENSPALVVLLFAASLRGLCLVPLSARLPAAELARLIAHAGASMVACTSAVSAEAARFAAAAGADRRVDGAIAGVTLLRPAPHPDQQPLALPEPPAERIAALLYTTGTTGTPKGVLLRQRNLLAVAWRSARLRGLRSDDVAYGVLPAAHVYGLSSVLLATLLAGATLHLAARFDARAAWGLISDGALSVVQGVPTLYAALLAHDTGAGCGRLRALFSGGAPLDQSLKRAVEARFALPLHNGYGLTENGPSICHTRLAAPRADDSVGPAIDGIELRVVDGQGAAVAPGQPGRLWVRGPGVMAGYFRAPELTARVLDADGWLDTGDLVRIAADGAVFVLGRVDELVIRSGFKVYPPEVEAAIRELPGVAQVAVVGHTLAHADQELVAFVVWRDAGAGNGAAPADPQQLRALLRERLAPYQIPTRWETVDALPQSPAGKVRKAELQARLGGGPAAA